MELRRDFGAVPVDPLGQGLQAGHEAIVGNGGLVRLDGTDGPGNPGDT